MISIARDLARYSLRTPHFDVTFVKSANAYMLASMLAPVILQHRLRKAMQNFPYFVSRMWLCFPCSPSITNHAPRGLKQKQKGRDPK